MALRRLPQQPQQNWIGMTLDKNESCANNWDIP